MTAIRTPIAALLALSTTVQAVALPPTASPQARGALFRALPPLLQKGVEPGMSRATFQGRMAAMFRLLDADGNGVLDVADADAYERNRVAILRSRTVAALTAFDTDADGRVSEAELASGIRRGLPLPPGQSPAETPESTAKGLLWSLDANGDGFIDYDEMRSAPLPESPPNPVEAMLALAPRGRDALTSEEAVSTASLVVFDLLDADGDGIVDEDEYAATVAAR